MTNPQITVFMAVYNGARFIHTAIESVLKQSFKDFELLIVNDGSTDESAAIISGFLTDPRVKLITNTINHGILYTRNLGLQEANGTYLAILDCDDIALPSRLELQYNYMIDNQDVAICGGHAYLINTQENQMQSSIKVITNNELLNMHLLFGNVFVHSSVMIKTQIFKELGGYSDSDFAEDYLLFCKIADKYRIANIDEYLVKYRVHQSNTSSLNASKMEDSEKSIIQRFHSKLGISNNEHLVNVHQSILHNQLTFSYSDYSNLLCLLKKANAETKIYSTAIFNKFLFSKWASIIEIKGGRRSFFNLFNLGLLDSFSYISFKNIRKAFKKSLKGHLGEPRL